MGQIYQEAKISFTELATKVISEDRKVAVLNTINGCQQNLDFHVNTFFVICGELNKTGASYFSKISNLCL